MLLDMIIDYLNTKVIKCKEEKRKSSYAVGFYIRPSPNPCLLIDYRI
jgi:hypothetical protein